MPIGASAPKLGVKMAKPGPDLRIRVVLGSGTMIGPGKADLLDGIRATGSIAAAGRRMGMSYKRAWLLVETLNAGFTAPLVVTARGGAGFGGATLTETGERVLALYRRLQARAVRAGAGEIAALERLADMADRKERLPGEDPSR